MNIQEKLVEEFERVIVVREGFRNLFRQMPTENEEAQKERLALLAGLNDVIDVCKTALGGDDALTTLKALELTKAVKECQI